MARIDAEITLRQVLKEHEEWLKDENCGSRADLSYTNLSYAKLRYANLRYANLRSADLCAADLSYANLSCVDLGLANLSCANLQSANLRSADLRSADLRYTKLPKGVYVFQGTKHQLIAGYGMIRIGCVYHSTKVWLKQAKEIGMRAGYSKDEIKDYLDFIKFYAKRSK